MFRIKVFLACALILVFTANCYAEKMKLGLIVPLSGSAALMGNSLRGVVQLVELKNITAVFEDDRCEGKGAVSAYLKLRNEGVHVFYMACSGSILAVAPLAQRNGDLILTTYAGSAKIRETGDEVIRLNPDAISIADGVAKLITSQLRPTVVLYEEQEYASSFVGRLEGLLGSGEMEKISYRPDAASYSAEILRIKQKKPKSIVLVPVGDGAARVLLQEMSQNGLNLPIIGEVNLCDYPFNPSEFNLHGSCVAARFESKAFEQFLSDYARSVGHPAAYPFYDAMALDLFKFLDKELSAKWDVPSIKKMILAGFQGAFANYKLSPSGESTNVDNHLLVKKF